MKRISVTLLWCCLTITVLPAFAQDHATVSTRTLAASCAACHGPDGNSLGGTPTLAALNQDYFIQRMQGFKDGTISATVMHQHAKGLTTEEITALASYFAQQPRKAADAAPQQSFKGAQ